MHLLQAKRIDTPGDVQQHIRVLESDLFERGIYFRVACTRVGCDVANSVG
jgi:hypothetical protein